MICYYLKNMKTGETACIFGHDFMDALRKYPGHEGAEWQVMIEEFDDYDD